MKKWFLEFPAGLPGAGLLLLRAAVAIAAWNLRGPGGISGGGFTAAELLVVILLLAGLATRIAAFAVAGVIIWSNWEQAANALSALPQVLAAGSLALLGPGAWSLDCWRFGRRVYHLGA